MSDQTAKFLFETVFLLLLIGVFLWPQIILGGAEKKALNWRMRLILKPFRHPMVLRTIAAIGVFMMVLTWSR